jgi:hypothetical protein
MIRYHLIHLNQEMKKCRDEHLCINYKLSVNELLDILTKIENIC